MKKHLLTTLTALGVSLNGWCANLDWIPSTAIWDLSAPNWFDTGIPAQVAYAQGDDVHFGDTGLAQPTVTLDTILTPGSVTVDAWGVDYMFTSTTGGKLSGTAPLLKKGGSVLILDADNAITATTTIEAGALQIGRGGTRGSLGRGPVINAGTLAINRTGTLNLSNSLSGPGSLSILPSATGTINMRGTNTAFNGMMTHSGAMLNFLGPDTLGAPSSISLAIVDPTSNVRLQISGGIALASGCPVTFSGATRSSVRVALQSMDGSNSVSGPILVGPGGVGGIVQLMAVNAGSLFTVNSPVSDLDPGTPYNGNFYLRGASGTGQLFGTIQLPAANLIKTDLNGTWTIYSTGNLAANTLLAQGRLRLGTNDALPNAPLLIGQAGTRAILDLGGFSQQCTTLNDIASGATPATATTNIIANSSTTSDSVLTIGSGGVYNGSIQDAISNGTRTVGLTLLSGTQQLTDLCTYSGPTTVQDGMLVLVGSGGIPNSTPIHLASGAALKTSTRSDGTLALGAGQTLKGNGTFLVIGNLTSQGTIELKVRRTGPNLANDTIQGLSQVTFGGNLKLDLSGNPLVVGNQFKLFSADTYAGAFDTITPATPGAGLVWDVSRLTEDGSIMVAQGAATNPTNLTTTVLAGGTQLLLAWPPDHTGWTLQDQTNALSVGLTSTWHDVPGSTTTNLMIVPIDRASGTVFYRLRY